MKITDFFDKTFCINLDRRFDRWSECVADFISKIIPFNMMGLFFNKYQIPKKLT